MATLTGGKIILPLLSKLSLNFTAGSRIRVKTWASTGLGTFRGEVFQNPSETCVKNSLTLIEVTQEETGKQVAGHLTLFQRDIESVNEIEAVTKITKIKETVMDTFTVTTLDQLESLLDVVQTEAEVGCYIPGAKDGNLTYVFLNIRDIFVVIPMENFVKNEKTLWEGLGEIVFANGKINKVFWDSREIADYLDHNHSLPLTNAFDLQAMELYLTSKTRNSTHFHLKNQVIPGSEVSLTDLLKKYLSSRVPAWEIEMLLKLSTSKPESIVSELKRKYYALQVKYLLLLKAAMKMEFFEPWKTETENDGTAMIVS